MLGGVAVKRNQAINLTAIMEQGDITLINRYVYDDGTVSFRVEISGKHSGYGSSVGEAYQKALNWERWQHDHKN